jgi:uncharacterized protein (TIGR02145 family)
MIKKHWQLFVALPFLFSSCDKILSPSDNGDWVQVKIRTPRIAGGAQNETITRASGEQKRMVQEPVTLSLGDGMLAEIIVEENLEALRANPTPQPLETNKTFRVIALKSSDKTYLSHADFKVGGGSNYSSPDLHVPENLNCDFICISFNNEETMPTMTAANISALAVVASKDLLYQRITASIDGNSSPLSFGNLRHQFAQLKLILDFSTKNLSVTAIPGSISFGEVATAGSFDLQTGVLSTGSNSSPVFSWGSLDQPSVTSNLIRFIPRTSTENYTISVPVNAISLSNSTQAPLSARTCGLPYNMFTAGYNYTIRVRSCKYMQDFTANDCKNMDINKITTLVDARDDKPYRVIRLKMSSDGSNDRCWMQQNLELGDPSGELVLTAEKSDFPSGLTLPAALNSGLPSYAGNHNVTNPAYSSSMPANSGYLYNWATAVAYSTTHYGGTTSAANVATDAQYSICPKGWRLPVGGGDISTNEFCLVDIHTYGGSGGERKSETDVAKWTDPWCFAAIYAGVYVEHFSGMGVTTMFWSSINSTNITYASAMSLSVDPDHTPTTNFLFNRNRAKYDWLSVRCVRRD